MSLDVKIPKIIAQTWKSSDVNTIPDHWKSSPASFQYFLPDWQYVLSGDKENRDFVAEHFPSFLPYYDRFEHNIMRVDAWRYCWLYVYGGMYADCDIELTQSIEELFYVDREFYACPSGNFANYYTNAIMAAKPGAKVFLDCIELMKQGPSWYAFGKHLTVMTTTGPMMFSRAVAMQDPSSYHILNSKLLTPCSVCDPMPCTVPGSYVRTLPGSSWIATDTRIFIYCKCQWRGMMILVTIILIVYLVLLSLRAFRKYDKCK